MGYDHSKEVIEFALCETLAFLRALHWSHQQAMWSANSYSEKMLFEKLTGSMEEEIKVLAEKCITFFGEKSIEKKDQAKKMSAILGWVSEETTLKEAEKLEDRFLGYLLSVYEMVVVAKKMTMGLDVVLQNMANTHEQNLFLLRQCQKVNKVGSMNINQRVANKYLEKKAIRGGVYMPTKELPAFIKKVLKENRYQKRDIEVFAKDRVESFGFALFEGNRPFAIAINLGSGQTKSVIGDYSGVTPELKGTLTLKENMAIVVGEHGGRGSFARLYLHPTNMATLLPNNEVELSENEKFALKYISIFNSRGRKEAFRQKGFGTYSAQHPLVKALAEKGYVKISGKAVRITTDGRNIAQGLGYEYEKYFSY